MEIKKGSLRYIFGAKCLVQSNLKSHFKVERLNNVGLFVKSHTMCDIHTIRLIFANIDLLVSYTHIYITIPYKLKFFFSFRSIILQYQSIVNYEKKNCERICLN